MLPLCDSITCKRLQCGSRSHGKTQIGKLKNILFGDIKINAEGGIFIIPKDKDNVSDFTLGNVELTVSEKQWKPEKSHKPF